MYPVNASHEDCNYHTNEIGKEGMGLCGCGKVISENCIGLEVCKCASFEPLVPRRKACPECIDPMDKLTDPNNDEGWMHTNPVQADLSYLNFQREIIPELPTPDSYALGCSLEEAKQIITGERQDSYGNPEDSFLLIARYWNTYIAKKVQDELTARGLQGNYIADLDAKDVAHMMILFKIARCQGQSPKRGNYIDIQGYAAIAADRLIPGGSK